jgi:septum formation protein
MRALSVEDIEAYVATDEWRDKAGGYAIQDGADRFVTCLEGGGRDNVVGLPVALALRLISEGLAPTPSAP